MVYDFDERRDFRLERSFYVVGASCRKLASDRVELIGPESYPGVPGRINRNAAPGNPPITSDLSHLFYSERSEEACLELVGISP